ncbi:MAG: ThuA domain-containing protein, partial [Acidobacteriota bacterium]
MERRSFVRGAAVALGAGMFRLSFGQQSKARRVVALIGDRYHNSDYIQVALTKMFEGLDLTVDYTTRYDKLSAAMLRDSQLFVSLRDGMIWPEGYLGPDAYTAYEAGLENAADFPAPKSKFWITEEQAGAVKDFVNAGGGFYSMHNNSHVSLTSKTYREVQGGAYIGHPPLRPFKVRVTNASHPITQGIKDFMVNDEQHYVEYDKDPKYKLLEAENVDGLGYEKLGTKSVAGWAYDQGKGR